MTNSIRIANVSVRLVKGKAVFTLPQGMLGKEWKQFQSDNADAIASAIDSLKAEKEEEGDINEQG